MNFETKVLHGYDMLDKHTGASSIPIFQASTFHQNDIDNLGEYTYSRFNNPTRKSLEDAVACLEKAKYGLAFSSGMAAISAVLTSFSSNDHIIVCQDVYGGTFQLACNMIKRFNVDIEFVDISNPVKLNAAIKENTKAIYMETPSNPLLKVTDIKAVCDVAKSKGIITIIDNTFLSPVYQNPITLGVDIVIHSATKFLNGHSDVILGLVVTDNDDLYKILKKQQIVLGGIPSANDCWLVMRGLKTMVLRMKQSSYNAMKIAEFLDNNEKVVKVYYPGLKSHFGYEINKKQASSAGAVLSFDLGSYENVKTFFSKIQIPIVAVSLGGVESILSYPTKMSHACISEKDRLKQGITDGLVRLSVGIENVDDLINDIENALNFI
jgi:cystathionine beta-lyase